MKKNIYYVATSLDGFIAGANDDISQFIMQGKGVDKYKSDLITFETILMGRKTYEFGYQFGLTPGQPAYPNMEHHIFSNTMTLDAIAPTVHIEKMNIDRVKEIQENSSTDIYVCGGGEFAGWLLDHGLIDQLKLKVNPIVLGTGTRLFGNSTTNVKWTLVDSEGYDDGLQIITYELKNKKM